MVLFAEVVLAAATVLVPSDPLADVEVRCQEGVAVADDAEEIERSELGKSVQTVEEVLVNGTVVRDLRIAEVLCVERQFVIVRDSAAAEAERYARRAVKRIAFATATRAPAPVDTVSDKFAVPEEAVDSAKSSVAESGDAATVAVVAALC